VTRMVRPVMTMAALALLVGGCSNGPTKSEYAAELRSTMAEVESSYGDSSADPEKTRVALADAAQQLELVEPPDELAEEHRELVDAVRDMSGAIRLLTDARAIAETDPKRAETLTRRFAEDDSFPRLEQAVTAIREAGVDVEL
jgi:hypothetical protein